MGKEEVKELLRLIKGAYSRFEINDRTLEVWTMSFEDQVKTEVMTKLKEHFKKNKFEPTIADLITHKYKPPVVNIEIDPLMEAEYVRRLGKNT